MKKLLSLLLAFVLSFAFIACSGGSSDGDSSVADKTFKIGVVDGAPALAVANLCGGFDYEKDGVKISTDVEIVAGAQNITAGLANGSFDMAIAPLNLASTLYNKSKNLDIKLASVNVFGVLYMVGANKIEDLNELKGEVVYVVGAGGTPEVVLKNILDASGVKCADGIPEVVAEDVVYINAVNDAPTVIAALKTNKTKFAVLGEPVVTQAMEKTGAVLALDLQAEWTKVHSGVRFVQAGLAVKGEVAVYDDYLTKLIEKMGGNKQFLYDDSNAAMDAIRLKGSALQTVLTRETIDRCLIGAERANGLKADVEAFLTALGASSYGGTLPGEDFYL